MVIAPLDANTLAKLANGICDNLLVSIGYWLCMYWNNLKTVEYQFL